VFVGALGAVAIVGALFWWAVVRDSSTPKHQVDVQQVYSSATDPLVFPIGATDDAADLCADDVSRVVVHATFSNGDRPSTLTFPC
jgi:hypothetical protein